MIDVITVIQILCSVVSQDQIGCEMKIHSCYREIKQTTEYTDAKAVKLCLTSSTIGQ